MSVPSRGSCDPAEWTAAHSRWRGVPPPHLTLTQEITWSYGDSYRSNRMAMGYKAGTKADPNAITPQQARTAFARYCKKIDVTREELAWNFGCISARDM